MYGFRLETEACPLDLLAKPWVWALLQDWANVSAFPSVPLSGTCLDDYDAWTLDALRILRAEQVFIDSAHADPELG